MKIKELRAQTGLSQSKFAAMFDISVRTLQAWEQDQSAPPQYVITMIQRLLKSDKTKDFNPMYDSEFLISTEGSDAKRYLVELYEEELLDLRAEINTVLQKKVKQTNV